MKIWLTTVCLALGLACGGGASSSSPTTPPAPAPTAAWTPVTAAIQAAQSEFPNGVCVEVATPAGVVYSQGFGGFTNGDAVLVASASKWVTSTVLMRLVDQGILSLETQTKALLVDRSGHPWAGNMGEITLRQLLSFTSGISGDDSSSENVLITLDEAVERIYDDDSATASAPGSYFYYGNTHMRIAARMAEVATGKSWGQLFDEQLRTPLGFASTSIYSGGGPNPNPAGGLKCTGLEYMRFLAMQLRGGLDGTQLILSPGAITAQRTDGYASTTTISYSPYMEALGKSYHYALGNWLETARGGAPSASDPVLRYSSTGTFGWAPWVAADGSYAAIVMTQQSTQGDLVPSETLKATLDPLIRAALAQNPPVVRAVP
jgi:CubicO group peptidase (beta-lactamase class C family)